MACKRGWPKYESGSCDVIFFQTKLSLIPTSAALLLIGWYSCLLGILCLTFYCLATTITTYPEGKKELKQQISGDESKFKHIQTLKVGHKSLFTYVLGLEDMYM